MPKTSKQITGNLGELVAREYLHQKGYVILEENWRFGRAEIDLIAAYQNTLVIVEVKRRKDNSFGFPEEAIGSRKMELLLEAAQAYLSLYPEFTRMRIDAISITDKGEGAGILHLEDF